MTESHSPNPRARLIARCRANELDPAVRAWLNVLFGREIPGEQEVSVVLGRAARLPTPEERRQAREQLGKLLDQFHERVKDVPEEEIEAALNEAMKAVRPSYEPLN